MDETEKCPWCKKGISRGHIEDIFFRKLEAYFHFGCPHCGGLVEAETIPCPEFVLTKPQCLNAEPNDAKPQKI